MGTIRPILFVTGNAGVIKADGFVVKDFRPVAEDPNLEVKGVEPAPVAEPAPVVEAPDPKGPASSVTESASDSDSETNEKSTPESETESSPAPNPIPPLVLSEAAASVVKAKSQPSESANAGKTKPPVAE